MASFARGNLFGRPFFDLGTKGVAQMVLSRVDMPVPGRGFAPSSAGSHRIAAGVLAGSGMDPEWAIELVSSARGQSVPETGDQSPTGKRTGQEGCPTYCWSFCWSLAASPGRSSVGAFFFSFRSEEHTSELQSPM